MYGKNVLYCLYKQFVLFMLCRSDGEFFFCRLKEFLPFFHYAHEKIGKLEEFFQMFKKKINYFKDVEYILLFLHPCLNFTNIPKKRTFLLNKKLFHTYEH